MNELINLCLFLFSLSALTYGLSERARRKHYAASRNRAWETSDYWRNAYFELYRDVLNVVKGKK